MENVNLFTIFITGLFVGGLTCMAVQGGLLASTIAQRVQEKLQDHTMGTGYTLPILSFLITKLIAYTLLGFFLGWLGSLFQFSLTMQIILQFLVVIFMVGTALNLLRVHPIFRYFAIQPPKFIYRLVRAESKSKSIFAPAVLGAFTILIPCGTTQAMMALAIGTGQPLAGAAVMFAFTLGTSPLFFILGYLATRLGGMFQKQFTRVAAFALIGLSVFNFNNTLALSGSPLTFDSVWRTISCTLSICDDSPLVRGTVAGLRSDPVREATIQIEERNYTPNTLTVRAGSQVTLNLVNTTGSGCTQVFTIPKLGIQEVIPLGSSQTIRFTAPPKPEKLAFMCGMGMYRGIIEVI